MPAFMQQRLAPVAAEADHDQPAVALIEPPDAKAGVQG